MKDKLLHRKVNTRNTYGDTSEPKDLFGMATDKEILEFIKGYNVTPLFLCITGSHMWNLAEPDADLDIRGIYVKPTEILLSIHKGSDTIEACNVLRKDIDIQLYEVEKAFRMFLQHNGNLIEMLLSPTVFYKTLDVDWERIAKKYLTKQLAHYYKGYYDSQRKRAARNRGGKALMYSYREIYQGIYLMRHGKLVYDFRQLKQYFDQEFQPSGLLDEFMDRKTWKIPIPEEKIRKFEAEWDVLLAILDREFRTSTLPETFESYSELNDILLDLRKKYY
jgi:predicted nucleotidyltransferase